eukprot:TRINITY_DN4948_c1_g3_i1.p1 TRINITY_DN4948_c1_g3~~TRINITY_DN4948_c1_g3_i1.p1  ORF type:complete len:121 (-),score=16.65 TRINITY_DN4948_c1_g3_i1:287-649(-)
MIYTLVGVGISAMPMAMVTDALTSIMNSGAYDFALDRYRTQMLQQDPAFRRGATFMSRRSNDADLNASASFQGDEWQPGQNPTGSELEMKVIGNLNKSSLPRSLTSSQRQLTIEAFEPVR